VLEEPTYRRNLEVRRPTEVREVPRQAMAVTVVWVGRR
jgi:hypothetical protein